ncbi:hypothetical protein ACJMK2_019391 [Sinanodonta woodiana]|uniref:NACHT domain-containing protein n=1 Tax=Sinanodonta woodiana TaxID=1069815 RepID=A0ABD3UGK0_SINWO
MLLVEDGMFSLIVLVFTVFEVIFLRIEHVIAFSYKSVSTDVIECEHNDARLIWEYKLHDGAYVKNRTWYTGVNREERRIAHWNEKDNLTIESEYRGRVSMIGKDSLLLRDVTTNDEGVYTLILSLSLSVEADLKLNLKLTIYIPPLKEPGCCRPEINGSISDLYAFLPSDHGCGKPLPILTWITTRNKKVLNERLILGQADKDGTYKVCVSGPAVDRCFTGDKDVLCKSYTVATETRPERLHVKPSLAAEAWVCIAVGLIVLALIGVKLILVHRRAQRGNARLKEAEPLIRLGENVRSVKSLTFSLIDIYKERSQFQKADSDLKLKIKVNSGSFHEPDIDIHSYTNVLCEHGVPLNRILITGEVGWGKKTWCSNLTQDWCNAQSENDSDTDSENIKFLRNFKLLFNVSLKNVEKFSNINELLTHLRIPIFETLNMDICKHLREHKAIFVIQGLEEYTGNPKDIKQILSDEHLIESLVIVTSRPTAWEKKYKSILSFDRIISVQGLDHDEMKKRAQRILHGHGFPHKAIENFFLLLKERGLEELTIEPIFFPYLVSMWQTNCSLPRNTADFLLNLVENRIKKKSRSLTPHTIKYRSDLGNSRVLLNKEFTIHYGKIMQGIGEIAFNILSTNSESCSFDETYFDNVFKSHGCEDEESLKFMKDFCVCIGLVSYEEDGDKQIFSFRHIMLQTFLAALYVSTLEKENKNVAAEKLKSLYNFSEFLKFIDSK